MKSAQRSGAAPAAKSAPAFDPTDPFAEWERANARVENRQNTGSTAKAMGVGETSVKNSGAAVRRDAGASAPMQRPAAQTPPRPAAPAAAPKPAPSSTGSDDFDLDDILNEFK